MLSSKRQRRPMKMQYKLSDEPKVSAIVPTYNRGYSISRALKSIEEQTQPVHEILVVDDGSTDDTQKIINQQHPTVQIIRNPANRGVSSARNLGISSATGSHLAFLDSDDTWHTTKIEKQLHFCQQQPKVNINHCDEIWIKNGKKFNQKLYHQKFGGDLFEQYDIHDQYDAVVSRWVVPHFVEWRNLIKSWSKIIKPGGFIIFDMPNREHIELFDENSKAELSNYIGYNHAKSSNETGFYASANEKELLELAQTTNLKLVSRRPHGIWKSNLKIASLMGGVAFKEFIDRMNKTGDDDTNFDIIKKIEIAASSNLEVEDFHGSIVIFQKAI